LCEQEPSRCRRVNVEGTAILATLMRHRGGRLVFYSTDHVFSDAPEPYTEDAPVAPKNVYAASKADAENAVRTELPGRHLILRTSWVYGLDVHRRNFVLRLIDQLTAQRPVRVPEDQWGTPTFSEDLAEATRVLVERGVGGTFHATGPDYLTRTALAARVCRT